MRCFKTQEANELIIEIGISTLDLVFDFLDLLNGKQMLTLPKIANFTELYTLYLKLFNNDIRRRSK